MIRFNCSCGKRLKARPQDAGCTVTCPQCGARTAAPGGAPALSAPEALAAAMRQLAQSSDPDEANGDDIPVAEVVDAPPDAAPVVAGPLAAPTPRAAEKARPLSPEEAAALAGLDALARAVPPKPAAAKRAEGRGPRRESRTAAAPGRTPVQANGPARRPLAQNPIAIAIAAAVGIVIILLAALLFVGGGGAAKKKNQPPDPEPSPPASKPSKRDWGDRPPGELFPNVPPEKLEPYRQGSGAASEPRP
ncbi:MAG: hypothetical protein FJ288_15655 [Planctomycetes bacterium]|nr:hypothetical protein [Planctomycetota bacterium]